MNKFYNAFKLRLVVLCMVAIFLIIAAVHAFMYFTIRGIITEQFGLSAQSIATAISGSIMENADEYERFIETRDVNSRLLSADAEIFRRNSRQTAPSSSSSTPSGPSTMKTVEFLLDAEPIGSEDYSAPGATTFMDEASRVVYASGRPAKLPPPGSTVVTDGLQAYRQLDGYIHRRYVRKYQPQNADEELLPRVHRVISLLKRCPSPY